MPAIGPLTILTNPHKAGPTPTTSPNASTALPTHPFATCSVTTSPPKLSNPSTPVTSTWLQPLGLTRDSQTWTYSLNDGQTNHTFPISVTGVISAITKTPQQLEQIMAKRHLWEARGNTTHQALEHFVNHRWNPASTWKTPLNTSSEDYAPYAVLINPMLEHPIWDSITPIGSELMVYCLKRNVAGTLDLIFKFPDGTFGIADLKTLGPSGKPYDIKPQLGAGVHMAGDRYGLLFSRCISMWARAGSFRIETHDAQECLDAWWNVLDTYETRFRPF